MLPIVKRGRLLALSTDFLFLVIVGVALTCVVTNIALREYTLLGRFMAFFALFSLSLVPILVTRFHLLSGTVVLAVIVSIDQFDQLKYASVESRLHPTDFVIAAGFFKDLDFSVLVQYGSELGDLLWGLAIAAAALPLLLVYEWIAIRRLRFWRAPTGTALVSLIAACAFVGVLVNSQYVGVLRQIHPAWMMWHGGGLRVGTLVASTLRLNAIDRDIRQMVVEADRGGLLPEVPKAAAATCSAGGCPDIIVVHLESVFDPSMLVEYHGTPGYLDRMDALNSAPVQNGLLRVHTWGGGSWVSEFAVLCGVNHALFGEAGTLVHVTLSPYVRHCLPNYLKTLGYETHAIYTSPWGFVGAGAGFKRYGVDDFIDIRKIKKDISWRDQRDRIFVDQARRLLERPTTHPRFIFVSTNWNHGPHGLERLKELYPGPFDVTRARDPALADYVNRLNDTFTEMRALERDLTQSGRRVALLFYGDHQPSFEKDFDRAASADAYAPPKLLTLYRFVRSYGGGGASPRKTLSIEELPQHFLDFAGLPLAPEMTTIRALRDRCGVPDENCSPQIRAAIGAAILGE